MKLLFVILAHNRPDHVVALARTVTQAAGDGHAVIHFDANASRQDFEVLSRDVEHEPKISLVQKRVRCRWGSYSLVEAVLTALRERREGGGDYDYAVLLSGSCLPCRPISQLERFLAENRGKEFIESQDESWMVGGLRKERYQLYFPVPPSPHSHRLMHYWVVLQRLLGIKRKPPRDMEVRFGSQWWCLTWETCKAILSALEQDPKIESFFRKTYIPDEMVFNTLVWNLAKKENIAQFGLSHFQFTDWGKPVVFFDDHMPYPFSLNRFFYRKVSDEAAALRKASLDRAFEEDDGEDLAAIGTPNTDYDVKVVAQTEFPAPGQMFYRDQFADMHDGILRRCRGRYIFVCGDEAAVDRVLSSLRHPGLQVMGRIFAEEEVDFGRGVDRLAGLRRDDVGIRDLHPTLYLTRVRQRARAVPVFGWVHGDLKPPMDSIVWDPKALVITMPPMAEDGEAARRLMVMGARTGQRPDAVPGLSGQVLREARAHFLLKAEDVPHRLTSALDGERVPNVVTRPVGAEGVAASRQAAAVFERSVEDCGFRFEPWFAAVLAALDKGVATSTVVDAGAPVRKEGVLG